MQKFATAPGEVGDAVNANTEGFSDMTNPISAIDQEARSMANDAKMHAMQAKAAIDAHMAVCERNQQRIDKSFDKVDEAVKAVAAMVAGLYRHLWGVNVGGVTILVGALGYLITLLIQRT